MKTGQPGFDHNGPGLTGKLFGLPVSEDDAQLIIVPVPWEVTVSQRTGTASAPKSILEVSRQIDLYSRNIDQLWSMRSCMLPFPESLLQENYNLRTFAASLIQAQDEGKLVSADDLFIQKINDACENMNTYVRNITRKHLQAGKFVGILGGDHSTPLGLIRALSEVHDRFAILQIDAHADLRRKYEGFTYSHGSIMFNALKLPSVARLVQVGVRDFCEEEADVVKRSAGRVRCFYDEDIKTAQFGGETWHNVCHDIISELPEKVYLSFDIDGLNPDACPGTGTPVPGGIDFDQAVYLLRKLSDSGKQIIGFDLCEVSSATEWDAQVGARMLFELCQLTLLSHYKLKRTIRK